MDANEIVRIVREYSFAGNPSAYFAFNADNDFYQFAGIDGFIVYRTAGDYVVQFGGPFCAPSDAPELLAEFAEHVRSTPRRLVSVQVQAGDVKTFLDVGFTVNQMGASYAVGLADFTLQGGRYMQLRNKITRARKAGVCVREADFDECADKVREVDEDWLSAKGADVKALEFLVGELGGDLQKHRRLFIAEADGEFLGYVSYAPVYGPHPGWMHDLSRRISRTPPRVMEAINRHAIDVFTAEGAEWLHFGFTPFTSLDKFEPLPGHSDALHWFMNYLWNEGSHIYPAQSQLAYKDKWGPTLITPEYVAFPDGADLSGLVHVFRACNAV